MALFGRLDVQVKPAKDRKQRGTHTDKSDTKVSCTVCGCPVRSKLGDVCSKRRCQQIAASRCDSFSTNKPLMITSGRR